MQVTFTIKSVNGANTPRWTIEEIIDALKFHYNPNGKNPIHHEIAHKYYELRLALADGQIEIQYDFTYEECLAQVTTEELYEIAENRGFFCSATKDINWTKDNLILFMERKAQAQTYSRNNVLGWLKDKIRQIGQEKLRVAHLDNSKM